MYCMIPSNLLVLLISPPFSNKLFNFVHKSFNGDQRDQSIILSNRQKLVELESN